MEENNKNVPLWVKILIVAMMLPVAGFPSLLSALPDDHSVRLLVWLYPLYVIISGLCAWLCWRQRPEITWILLILMLLSHLGVYYLALAQV